VAGANKNHSPKVKKRKAQLLDKQRADAAKKKQFRPFRTAE